MLVTVTSMNRYQAFTAYMGISLNMVDGSRSLIEPLVMKFLGVIIGGHIVAIYLTIFEMGKAI